MKQNTFFLLVLILPLILGVSSCGSKQAKDPVATFRSSLTSEDTIEMVRMCDEAMEMLKNKEYDKLMSRLYEYDDSTKAVSELAPETAQRYINNYMMFPVISYERVYYSFMLEGCNDVKYSVVFATAEQTGTGQEARTSFMFNPVKVDGTWKLCVKTDRDMMDAEHN